MCKEIENLAAENAALDLAEMVCVHEEQIAKLWAAVFPEKEEANG